MQTFHNNNVASTATKCATAFFTTSLLIAFVPGSVSARLQPDCAMLVCTALCQTAAKKRSQKPSLEEIAKQQTSRSPRSVHLNKARNDAEAGRACSLLNNLSNSATATLHLRGPATYIPLLCNQHTMPSMRAF